MTTAYDLHTGAAGLRALVARYCPQARWGHHFYVAPDPRCIYCHQEPADRREPSEAGEQGLTGVPGRTLHQVVDSLPSLASRRSDPLIDSDEVSL